MYIFSVCLKDWALMKEKLGKSAAQMAKQTLAVSVCAGISNISESVA